MQNLACQCPERNTEKEPEAVFIHSASGVQHSEWNEWARNAIEFLKSAGWVERRIGPSIHLMHPLMAGYA